MQGLVAKENYRRQKKKKKELIFVYSNTLSEIFRLGCKSSTVTKIPAQAKIHHLMTTIFRITFLFIFSQSSNYFSSLRSPAGENCTAGDPFPFN